MPASTTVLACIRAQTGSTPPGGAQLRNLPGLNTGVLEGCLNSNLPLPPGVPYAHGSIDPLWTVDILIEDAKARMAAGGAKAVHLIAVMPKGGGGQLGHFKIGKAPKKAKPLPKTKKAATSAAKGKKKTPKSNR